MKKHCTLGKNIREFALMDLTHYAGSGYRRASKLEEN